MRLRKAVTSAVAAILLAGAASGAKLPGRVRRTRSILAEAEKASEVRPVTQSDTCAVLLAIKDEIYAGDCAAGFGDIGRPVGQNHRVEQINVFFAPSFHDGNS